MKSAKRVIEELVKYLFELQEELLIESSEAWGKDKTYIEGNYHCVRNIIDKIIEIERGDK